MSKKKRPLTTEELAKKVFPKKVIEAAKEVAHENDPPDEPNSPEE